MKDRASLWYRSKGNLYASFEQKFNGDKIREVEFTNATAAAVTIRQIEIYCNQGKFANIRFKISPFKWDVFKKTCNTFFSSEEILVYSNLRKSISLKWTENSYMRIMTLFEYLYVEHGEEYSDDFWSELVNIHSFIYEEKCIENHLLPSDIPDTSKEQDLIMLLKEYRKDDSPLELKQKLNKALVTGANPNQKNAKGETPLSVLFLHMHAIPENRDVLSLLLFTYGANIWVSVNKVTGYSLIELFKYQQSPEDFAYWESWMQSPVYLKKTSNIRVEGIDLIATKKSILTKISLNNASTLWSELKAMKDLEHSERKALFPLYSQAFHSESGNILASFEHAFSPLSGKLIDILFNQDGIIGANVFIIKYDEQSIPVYIDLSFLHPRYRGVGIMPLIDFRIPFALQFLYGDHQLLITFLAASFAALRKVGNGLFFPKYQAKNMVDDVKALFSAIYDCPLQWQCSPDGIYLTAREEEHVSVMPPSNTSLTPMEVFYYTQLCSSGNGYVPVMVYPGMDMLQMLHNILGPRQVNFLAHCKELAAIFSESDILPDINPAFHNKKPSNRIYESWHLFFNKQRIPVPDTVIQESFSQPEMRHSMHHRY